jgi:hypothetical protein
VNWAKSWKRLRNGSILSTPARANCRKYAQALALIDDDSGGVRRGGGSISIRLERAICRALTACVDTPGADSQHCPSLNHAGLLNATIDTVVAKHYLRLFCCGWNVEFPNRPIRSATDRDRRSSKLFRGVFDGKL